MEIFLVVADVIFFVFAILFIFFPKSIVTLSKLANQVLVYTDEKIYARRKLAALVCLSLSVFLTVVIMILNHLIFIRIR